MKVDNITLENIAHLEHQGVLRNAPKKDTEFFRASKVLE